MLTLNYFMHFCTVHCNIITKYKQTNDGLPEDEPSVSKHIEYIKY